MNTSLSKEQIDIINAVIADRLLLAVDEIAAEAKFMELGADSLTVIEIGLALEERFQVTMPDELLDLNSTVGNLYEAMSSVLQPR